MGLGKTTEAQWILLGLFDTGAIVESLASVLLLICR